MPSYVLIEGAEARPIEVEPLSSGRYRVTLPDGRAVEVDASAPQVGRLNMIINGRVYDLDARAQAQQVVVTAPGHRHELTVLDARQHRLRAATGSGARGASSPELKSPMAGKVVQALVATGDVVTQGQPVIIVEAMKMENDLKAPISGVVAALPVSPGQTVEIGDVLLVITPEEGAP